MPYTSQQIREAYNRLPQALKDALDADETDDVIFAIRKEFGITIDQMGDLSQEIGAVFVGIAPAVNFISAIEKRLGIPREKAGEIGKVVDERIFKHIRARTQEQKNEVEQTAPIVDQRPPAFDSTNYKSTTNMPEPEVKLPSPVPAQVPPTPTPIVPTEIPQPTSMPVIPSLMEQKLSAPFSAPAEKIKNGTSAQIPPITQAKIDPYREPVE